MRAGSLAGLRPLHLAAVLGLALVASAAAAASAAPTFRATASMTPQVQYLNDTTGTVFTFTVINIGDTPFAAVDIARPSSSWVIKTCPLAPAGWTTERHVWGCRYRSRVTAADDIPGHTSNANFRVKATVAAGPNNLVGRWRVVVSRTRSFSLARDLRSAPPLTPGLRMVAHSFQVLDAVVVPSALAIGSACPAPTAANHSAITGSTGHTIAICGRNRTNAPRTPRAAHSSLGGTFVASHGGFASGVIRANSGNVVLGNWSNVAITPSAGAGKTIAAKIGSNPVRTSPLTALSGYTATNEAPVAAAGNATTNEDTASGAITLSASDANGDTMAFSIASAPAHGSLSPLSPAACPSTAPAAHTCTATVVYTPAANYNGPDSFTYRASDSFGAASAPALVSLTINQVNDPPVVNPATFSIFENRPNGTFIGLVSSSDVDTGQTRTYSIQAGNTGGAFAINGSTGSITVANSAAVDFEATPSFNLTVRATDNGSPVLFGQATVTVNLSNINDAPTLNAISDPAAILEDAGEQNEIFGGVSAGAGESQTLVVTASSSNPGLIPDPIVTYVSPNATGSLAYTPVANQSGSAVITVTVGDNGGTANGGVDSFSRTFTVTVTPVNDSPVVFMTFSDLVYTEGDSARAIDSGLTVTDPDSTIQGAVVGIQEPAFDSAEDELGFINQNGITGAYNDGTGVLTLTGTASVANYQAALRSVTYTNSSDNPSGTKIASFQVTDSSGAASTEVIRDIDLVGVNDGPVVSTSAGSTAATEGAAGVAIDGSLAVADPDDTNIESGQVRISSNFQSGDDLIFVDQNGISGVYNTGTGVLALTGTASKADYQTALRSILFRTTNDDPAASKTVEFKLNDGSADSNLATKGISVSGVNDGPVITAPATLPAQVDTETDVTGVSIADPDSAANDITFTVATGDGDSTLTFDLTVAGWAEGTEVNGNGENHVTVNAPLSEINATLAATNGLVYRSEAGFSGATDTIDLDVNDQGNTGSGGALLDDATITVDFNEPPLALDDSFSTVEDTQLDLPVSGLGSPAANDTDTEGDPLTVTAVSNATGGSASISGGQIHFMPSLNLCGSAAGGFDYTVSDGQGGTDTGHVTVDITCVDDPPTAVDDSATVLEDAAASAVDVLANDTDPEGDSPTISSASDPANGTVVLTGGAPGAHTGLTYQPDPNYCNDPPGATPDTFTYTLNGGSTATVSVTVTCAPDDPVVDNSAGSTSYTENAAAISIDPALTVTDPDAGATITGATVQITGGYAAAEDILALAGSHSPITASPSGDTLTLTGTASPAAYQAALRDVSYRNSSDSPSTAARTVTFTVTDDTARTGSDTKGLTVVAVDDPPVAVNDSATVLEDAAASAVDVLANDTDVDAGPKTISSASDPANGTVVLTGGAPGAHTGLTYQPDPNYCNDPPGTTPDTFTYTLNGGSTATVSVTVTCVNDAPVADDETFSGVDSAVGNTTFIVNDPSDGAPAHSGPKKVIVGDILDGDTDVDGPEPIVLTAGTFSTNDGGSVTLEADGDFTFQPAAATSCTDTSDFFDYTISDSYSPPASDTGRVTINISGCVWYVNNNASGNSGSSIAPFDTLAQAETASGAGHTVFVYDGDNTSSGYDTGFAMKSAQRLIGESEGLVVGGVTLLGANAGATPSLTASNEDVIDLDDGNEVKDFNIEPQGTGGGIAGSAGDTGGGSIDDVNIVDTGTAGAQPGLELNGTTGTWNVSDLTVDNSAATSPPSTAKGVVLSAAGTVNFASAGTISINTLGAAGLDADSTNMGSGSVFDSITVAGSGSGGILLVNTTGTTQLGDGSGADLSLTTTTGSTAALLISSGGTVSVPGAGTANISATGGPAISISGTTITSLSFDDVDSTNSASSGISLSGLGAGTFTANSGDITGAAGTAFSVSGGSGTITYPGSLGNGSGATASITNRTGGTVTLSGAVTDTNDAGGGITISSNTGGSTVFSNAVKTLSTGTGIGVLFNGGDGHTLTLSGGGLDIDTTTGKGIDATGIGVGVPRNTLNITGSGNTIDTGTGRALEVVNTDVGASDLTFERISSNGAINGIRLEATGNAGGLNVTGNGTANSGGTIQSSTGPGILLASVGGGVDLTRVRVMNGGDDGIRGTTVAGFTLDNGSVTGNGNAVGESGFDFTGLTGTAALTDVTATGNADNNLSITNDSGTLNLSVTGGSYGSNSTTIGNDGILLIGTGSGTMTANIQGPIAFTNNRGDHVQMTTDATTTVTQTLTINNAQMSTTLASVLGGGITFNPGGNATASATITNNDIQGAFSSAITIDSPGSEALPQPVDIEATITGNTIGTAGTVDSGSESGNGIQIYSNGTAAVRALVTDNQIHQYANLAGIDLLMNDGNGTINATVQGNTIANPGTFASHGVFVRIGTSGGTETATSCVDLGHASDAADKNSLTGSGAGGGTDVRVRQLANTTVRLPGYAGSNNDTAAVVAFLQARNNPTSTPSGSATVSGTGGGFVGGAACTLP